MDRTGGPGSAARANGSSQGGGARPARTRAAFSRGLHMAGWDGGSTWGYDAELECYWVELCRGGGGPRDEAPLRIGPEHLISTVSGLARAMAFAASVADVDAYLALTA